MCVMYFLFNTSNATIIRLSHKVGFNGFKELKIELIKNRELKRFNGATVDFSSPFSPIDDLETIFNSMTDLYINSLSLLRKKLNFDTINKIAKTILNANRVYMFSTGDSGITVKGFINKAIKLDVFPIFAMANHDEASIARHIQNNDVAIFVSYDQYPTEYMDIGEKIADSGCRIVLITSNAD